MEIQHNLTPRALENGGGTSCMQKLTNLFCCRFSINWTNVALIALTVLNVVAAVTNFFAGQIVWGVLFSVAGVTIASMRKSIVEFTNLHSAGNRFHHTHNQYVQTNARLNITAGKIEGETKKLQKENVELKKTVAEFVKENKTFGTNNQTYGSLLGKMSTTVDKATQFLGALDSTTKNFDNSTKKALNDYLETVNQFKGILNNVARMQEAFAKDVKGSVNLFSGLMTQFNKSTADQLDLNNAIIREAGELKKEREQHKKELASVAKELEKKKQELDAVTEKLKVANDTNLDTAQRLNAAVQKPSLFARWFGRDHSKAAAAAG